MTDREAIIMLQGSACTPVMRRAINRGIKALEEREERARGCAECDCKSAVNALMDAIPNAKFCPMCGRPLKED